MEQEVAELGLVSRRLDQQQIGKFLNTGRIRHQKERGGGGSTFDMLCP